MSEESKTQGNFNDEIQVEPKESSKIYGRIFLWLTLAYLLIAIIVACNNFFAGLIMLIPIIIWEIVTGLFSLLKLPFYAIDYLTKNKRR